MNKKIKMFVALALCLTMALSLPLSVSAATTSLNWWWLIDTGGHLDWTNEGTKYLSQWKSAVNMWNAHKPGVIREDTGGTINDLNISDVNEVNNTNATTYWYTAFIEGSIKFNIYNMDKLTTAKQTAVAAHECGHALGLAHNTSADIMYEYTPLVNTLSVNDKASYDLSYPRSYNFTTNPSSVGTGASIYSTPAGSHEGLPVYYSCSSYFIDVNSLSATTNHADYVFVGTISEYLDESYKNYEHMTDLNGNTVMWGEPYTNYQVSVLQNIKGNLSGNIFIQKFGGLDQSGDFYIIPEGDIILEEGNTYIFFAYEQDDGSLIVRGKNSTLAYTQQIEQNVLSAYNEDVTSLQSSNLTETQHRIVGEYNDENKQQVIEELLANNPGALVFTSIDEYNAFIDALHNPEMVEESVINSRSTRTTKHIRVNIGITCFVNLYYDYLRTTSGTVTTVYQDSVYTSLTGYSPGITYEEQLVNVRRTSSTHIQTDWAYTLHYYLLIDGLIELGAEDVRYALDHNTSTDTTEFTQVY